MVTNFSLHFCCSDINKVKVRVVVLVMSADGDEVKVARIDCGNRVVMVTGEGSKDG